jgi:hypothetical protein
MSLSIPTKQNEVVAFGLLVTVSAILFFMLSIRARFHYLQWIKSPVDNFFTKKLTFMRESSGWHTLVYLVIFAAVVAALFMTVINN